MSEFLRDAPPRDKRQSRWGEHFAKSITFFARRAALMGFASLNPSYALF
jgi:hypothetical protein